MTGEDAAAFEHCISTGGIALFPSDTVYGLASAPDSKAGVERLYRIKERPASKPAAIMFFELGPALSALPELGQRTREALARLLPGPVTVIVANPARRFRLACGSTPDRLGLRVPRFVEPGRALASVSRPVLQTSANRSGSRDARRLCDVDPAIRSAVDLELDVGELPGTSSTVVDLVSFEASGEHRILRHGALAASEVREALTPGRHL